VGKLTRENGARAPGSSTLRAILRRAASASGDVTIQLSDMVVYFGYFSVCIYIGGAAWVQGFNAEAKFDVYSGSEFTTAALLFLEALSRHVLLSLGSIGVFCLLALAYFLSRFVFRLWFGLVVVFALFCLLALGAATVGRHLGETEAKKRVCAERTFLPDIYVTSSSDQDLKDGKYKLLRRMKEELILVKVYNCTDTSSVREFRVLNLRNVESYKLNKTTGGI
jgi:hypothetical protein